MNRIVAALLSLTILTAPDAALAADAAKGKILAERWCASCHVVASGQQLGNTQAPPFSEVAKKDRIDAPMVAYYLMTPHPRMPDMNLSRNEAADLAAYIVSLK